MNVEGRHAVNVKIVGVGGAGGNAVSRMATCRFPGLEYLAFNTDSQALRRMEGVHTFEIGPETTGGMGAGGNPNVGRKAIRESYDEVSRLLDGADMVFITAGMGGGTGTGAASIVAEMAKKKGALTVAVVTHPFSFEGPRRADVADRGLQQLERKVDTLIKVENDKLLLAMDGKVSIEKAFGLADDVLRQGVEGISEIIGVSGIVNVDFADVRAIMSDTGTAFMAIGEGKGKLAAKEAVQTAIANPLYDAPLTGASGILFNVKGGKDLSIGQVNDVATIIRKASCGQAQVVFGVVQDKKWKKRVRVTLVATGVRVKEIRSVNSESTKNKIDNHLVRWAHGDLLNGRRERDLVGAGRWLLKGLDTRLVFNQKGDG